MKSENEIPKFDLKSEDVVEGRRQELLRIFPEAHTESGEINFEALRLSLGDAVQTGPEGFGMSWPGKAECAKTIQRQSVATLLPVENESVDWDTTQNVIIEGDNLEVLKVLQKAYLGKIKVIYIDPPYNTGKDFIYPDNYTESLKTYLQFTGQIDDEGRKFSTNTESSGRFHSKWMNMMYPRLSLARNLLRDDGLLFVSIDDSELANLIEMLKEIFGESNMIATLIHQRAKGGGQAKYVVRGHDYLVCISKDISKAEPLLRPKVIQQEVVVVDGISYLKNDDVIRRSFGKYDKSQDRRCFYEELEEIKGPVKKKEIDGLIASGQLFLEKHKTNGMHVICELTPVDTATSKVYSIIRVLSEEGKNDLEELELADCFDYPKPVEFVKQVIQSVCLQDKEAIVLDFFAGSATTGQAVMSLNADDDGNRKFVLIQLPEPLTDESAGIGRGFSTIASIARERLRRAADHISSHRPVDLLSSGNQSLDLGFRSFKLDESNFAVWDANAIEGDETKLEQQLFAQVEHVLPGRTNQDILFELMLKSRFELTTQVEKAIVGKCEVWKVAGGEMVAVIDSGLTIEVIREIAGWKPTSVVILDRCFGADDSLKANARKIFEDSKVDLKTV